jgi:hypothetical protein
MVHFEFEFTAVKDFINNEIPSYKVAKIGHYGRGLSPVMLNFEYLKLGWLRPVQWSFENRHRSAQEECCLKYIRDIGNLPRI